MVKRIILLCDGTGNSASRDHKELATNVKRLSDAIAPKYKKPLCADKSHEKTFGGVCQQEGCGHRGLEGPEDDQIVYYQSGVGTAQYGSLYAGGTGAGINDNILDAYHFLASNYQKGDEIFIFGFSRGAYTARVVANLVQQLGIFYKRRLWMMRKAWIQYKKDDNGKSFEYFVKNLWAVSSRDTQPAIIKVLGVWDTVGCVGKPDYVPGALNSEKYYQTDILEGGCEYVFHALAADEYRRTFGPTMLFLPKIGNKRTYMGLDKTGQRVTKYVNNAKQTVLKQCWFPGVHSNVGGSYQSEHIADIALGWIVDQCIIHGNLLNFDRYALYRIIDRHLHPEKNTDAFHGGVVREYPGWGAGTVYDSFKGSKWYVTWQYRAPGNYIKDEAHPGRNNTDHPGRYSAWGLPSWTDMTSWFRKKPTDSDYCEDPTCCHPAKQGKYPTNEYGFPELVNLPPSATCETIHGSMWARYEAHCEAHENKEREKKFREGESERQKAITVDKPKDDEEKALPTSLLDWDPESLAPFRTGEKHDAKKKNRYNRQELFPGGPIVWIGRCLKTGKLFQMLEEPDRLQLQEPSEKKAGEEAAKTNGNSNGAEQPIDSATMAKLLRNKAYNRFSVGPVIRQMNASAPPPTPLPIDNPYKQPSPPPANETPEEKAKREAAEKKKKNDEQARIEALARETEEEKNKRLKTEWEAAKKSWMDYAYLQEDFELEELDDILKEREAEWVAKHPDPTLPKPDKKVEEPSWWSFNGIKKKIWG